MASPKRKQPADEGPPGVAPWLVTFSDCMTLLLCFFVLLTTFSSFDEQALRKLEGVLRTPSMDAMSPDRSIRDYCRDVWRVEPMHVGMEAIEPYAQSEQANE